MKKEYEENIAKVTKDIIKKLATVANREVPQKDADGEQLYNTLKDTFNAFDADGSGGNHCIFCDKQKIKLCFLKSSHKYFIL